MILLRLRGDIHHRVRQLASPAGADSFVVLISVVWLLLTSDWSGASDKGLAAADPRGIREDIADLMPLALLAATVFTVSLSVGSPIHYSAEEINFLLAGGSAGLWFITGFFVATYVLPKTLILDFRADIGTMELYKALPLNGWQVFAGQVVVAAMVASMIEWTVLIGIWMAPDNAAAWWLGVAGLFVLTFNLVLFLRWRTWSFCCSRRDPCRSGGSISNLWVAPWPNISPRRPS